MPKEFHGHKSKFTEVRIAVRSSVLYSVVACQYCVKALSFLQNLRQFGNYRDTTMNK